MVIPKLVHYNIRSSSSCSSSSGRSYSSHFYSHFSGGSVGGGIYGDCRKLLVSFLRDSKFFLLIVKVFTKKLYFCSISLLDLSIV